MLLEAWQWAEAMRLIHLCQRTDLIDSHFTPCLHEAKTKLIETLNALDEQLEQQTSRLVIVRENKDKWKERCLGKGHCYVIGRL